MARNKVEICGVDTSKLPVLKNEEMRELFREFQNGSEAAREELVNGNLRLVLSVIQRFNNRGENVDDLFQIGCIGLMKSIDNFDLSQNVKFSTYAVPMIIGEIRRYLRDNNPIRVSRSLRDTAYKALQAKEKLMADRIKDREPTVQEIAAEIAIPKEDIVFALDAIQDPVSLFEPIYNDGGDPIYVMDQVSDDNESDSTWLDQLALQEAMHRLDEREKHIVNMRFFQGKTQMEVAEEIGISQAQVSRLEKGAIQQMNTFTNHG
ncbi:RNA polymerase sigma (RpsG/SigG) subunit [Salsuginibacillus halophilus]|uniref:RNA polymerase sigma factor n=1 Tax=Salsuginibacillus halophilus TaxID=517424 RepID=A0A2P8HWZ1_9BACI|nr:RNA polymerase sporulation sigma factor SigG [Salsuginibacillus halophilus]PSL50763.1 RNA polymerase sigma (RpsG/SigG) subunit [Salsuginibacillus halophilus]